MVLTINAESVTHQDSPPVDLSSLLSSFDKEELDRYLLELKNKIAEIITLEVAQKIIFDELKKTLDQEPFISKIRSIEDFKLYAESVLKIFKSIKLGSEPEKNYYIYTTFSKTIISLARCTRENFDQDLKLLVGLIERIGIDIFNFPSTTLPAAMEGIGPLIKDSQDLEYITLIVEVAASEGLTPSNVISNLFGITGGISLPYYIKDNRLARVADWQDIFSQGVELRSVSYLALSALTKGFDPSLFMNGVGRSFIKDNDPAVYKKIADLFRYIADQVSETISKNYERTTVFDELQKFLNIPEFAADINSMEDLEYYVDKFLDTLILIKSKNNNLGDIFSGVSELFQKIANLSKGNLRQDLDVLIEILSLDLVFSKSNNILLYVEGISPLLNTSEDLVLLAKSIKKIASFGLDGGDFIRIVFGNENDDLLYVDEEELALLASWKDIIKDGDLDFELVLKVMESASIEGKSTIDTVSQITHMNSDDRAEFIKETDKFIQKGIPVEFVMNYPEALEKIDLSKDGLAMFADLKTKKIWLGYCGQILLTRYKYNEWIPSYFQEALAEDSTAAEPGLREYVLDLLKSTIRVLYTHKNFELILILKENVSGVDIIVNDFDRKTADSLTGITFMIPYLGDEAFVELYPLIFEKAKSILRSDLKTDSKLAIHFIENLGEYHHQDWVVEMLNIAIDNHFSAAERFASILSEPICTWNFDDWVPEMHLKAKSYIAEHNIEWDLETEDYQDPDDYFDEIPPEYDPANYGTSPVETFVDYDPFENHPLRKVKTSLGLGRLIRGEATAQELGLDLTAEAERALAKIGKIIESEHEVFIRKLLRSHNVPEVDKIALTDPENSTVKMNNLLPNVQNFVGRYLAQLSAKDLSKLSSIIVFAEESINFVIRTAYNKYLEVYGNDIPLYDKLYAEFDNWRQAGRYPMEVYLGRDGIYAYIGRVAQDAARRSILGRLKRKELREVGDFVEINPKCVVYPSHFRDSLEFAAKREFLKQAGISPDIDTLFYDTGYSGTIPTQIMKIMGFDNKTIQSRIRMLSSPSKSMRVRLFDEDAMEPTIKHIEDNSQMENSASGLFRDPVTGKIRPVAGPTSAEDQFYFMMIKQAIARHYLIKERTSHFAPDNVNYAAENHYLRIGRSYVDNIPQELIDDPESFLESMTTHTDDESYFYMNNGVKVLVKKVESMPLDEEKKEYMILLLAQQKDLRSVKPVGFVSGRTEDDASYLLVEHMDGISGADFENYLNKTGRFTQEEVKKIMREVSTRLAVIANSFRKKLNIDKDWKIKDTIIQFDEDAGKILAVIPTGWENIVAFTRSDPHSIESVK